MFAGILFTVIEISFIMAKTFLGLGVLDGDEITTSEALDMAFETQFSEVEMFADILFKVILWLRPRIFSDYEF